MRAVILILTCAMLGLSGCSGSVSSESAPPAPASNTGTNAGTNTKSGSSYQSGKDKGCEGCSQNPTKSGSS